MKDPAARDSLDGLLRDLDARLARQERHSHRNSGRGGVSTDYGNQARIGTDGLIYTNQAIAKVTQPDGPDFGIEFIPYGSIWVVAPPSVEP